MNNVAVNTRKANGVNSAITKRRKNVGVDLAGKNHLRHLQCVIVSYAPAFDDRLLDAQFFGQVAELLAPAVDNADANAHLVNQGELFAQRDQPVMIFGNFAGKLNNERLSFEALNVGQCFTQKVQTQLAVDELVH